MNYKAGLVERRRKMTVSGGLVELLDYDWWNPAFRRSQNTKFSKNPPSNSDDSTPPTIGSASSVRRAKVGIKRLVYSNDLQYGEHTKFLTLTKQENWGLTEAGLYFKNFIKRLNYSLNLDLKYVAVPEFQKRGSVHYHAVLFNFPFVSGVYSRLRDLWGGDRLELDVLKSHSDVEYAVPYISKYVAKQFEDKRFFGRRRYYPSRALKIPVRIDDDVSIQMTLPYLQDTKRGEVSFDIPFLGNLKYQEFFIKEVPRRQDIFDRIGVVV